MSCEYLKMIKSNIIGSKIKLTLEERKWIWTLACKTYSCNLSSFRNYFRGLKAEYAFLKFLAIYFKNSDYLNRVEIEKRGKKAKQKRDDDGFDGKIEGIILYDLKCVLPEKRWLPGNQYNGEWRTQIFIAMQECKFNEYQILGFAKAGQMTCDVPASVGSTHGYPLCKLNFDDFIDFLQRKIK